MMIEELVEQLKRDEGLRLKGYLCPAGYWTIGYGHNVENGPPIPEEAAELILIRDIRVMEEAVDAHFPWTRKLDDARRGVLVNMAFNLGIVGLREFKRTLNAVEDGKYEEASRYMLESKWASQVKERAMRLSQQMAKGEWR